MSVHGSCSVFRETTTNIVTKLTFEQLCKEIREAAVLQRCPKTKIFIDLYISFFYVLLSATSFASSNSVTVRVKPEKRMSSNQSHIMCGS